MNAESAEPDPSPDPSAGPCLTGHLDMDRQHQRIFQALQRLDESLRGPSPLATLGDRIKQLETMTLDHFRDEEGVMETSGYPHHSLHRIEHQVMEERLHDLIDQYGAPGSPPLTHLCETFVALLLHHIQTVDLDYAAFLEQRAGAAENVPEAASSSRR